MALVAVLVASACGEDEPPVQLEGRTNERGTRSAVNDLEIEIDDAYFAPTYVRASAGQDFAVELHNEGTVRHTFTAPDLGVDLELEPGDRRTVSITAPGSGHAVFHCRFHQLQGMQGAVFVR